MSTVRSHPSPGSTALPRFWARLPETAMIRHTLSWMQMSMMMEMTMANAIAAPSLAVKTAVWVRKPGPMAEVAMRKMAPTIADEASFFFFLFLPP